MRLVDGKFLCTLCGKRINLRPHDRPTVIMKAASGKSDVRVIKVGDTEVHSCSADPDAK